MTPATTELTDNQLLAQLLRAATWVAVTLIVAYAAWSMHNNYRAAQALATGTDPLGVACVFARNSNACALAAARMVPQS
jgi:hypothetical protein